MTGLRHRLARPLFWATLVFSYGAAIMPSDEAPDLGAGDKVNHIAAFLLLSLLARHAYRSAPVWRTGLGLSLFGVVIELSQAIPILNRDASLWDWVADTAAVVVGLGIALVIERWPARRD